MLSITLPRFSTAGRSIAGVAFSFILLAAPLFAINAPALWSPAAGSAGIVPTPSFTWSPVAGADRYRVQIADDAGFMNVVVDREVDIPRFVPVTALSPTTKYWRVCAIDAAGASSDWASSTYLLSEPAHRYNVPAQASAADVRAIVALAIQNRPAIVTFEESGNYVFDEDPAPSKFLFEFTNAADLILDGNNAQITIKNNLDVGFLRLNNATRVVVRGFRVDYDPVPHSLVDVVSNNSTATNLDVRVRLRPIAGQESSEYYPALTNNPAFTDHWSWAVLLDPARPGQLKQGVPGAFGIVPADATYIEGTSPAEYRIYHPGSSSGMYFSPGDILAILCRTNVGSFCSTVNSTDVTFDRITCYATPMGNYYSYDGSDLKVLNCQTVLRDATRFMTAMADGVHCRANTMGPWVENCTFVGNGDDGVALYNKGIVVKAKLSPTSLKVASEFMNLRTGDLVKIYTPKQGTVSNASYTVQGTPTSNGDGTHTVTFTAPLTTADYNGMTDVGLADTQQNVQLFNATRRNDRFMIANNHFTVRGRGAIIRSATGVVEDNRFHGCSGPAVIFANEAAQWFNGLYCRDAAIVGNDIQDCSFDRTLGPGAGAITVRFNKIALSGSVYVDAVAPSKPHQNILIADNSIKNFHQHGIHLSNVIGGDVIHNTFTSDTPNYALSGTHYGIYVDTTDGSYIAQNDLSGERRELTAVVHLTTNNTNAVSADNIPPANPPLVKDNTDATGVAIAGSWSTGSAAGYYGTNYLFTAGGVGKSVEFTPTIGTTAHYEVYARWVAASNRATNAPIDVTHAGGTISLTVNQQVDSGRWILLGIFPFNAGTAGNVTVRADGADGYVVADAVKFVYVPDTTGPTIERVTATPDTLWSPNHEMVPVTLTAAATDAVDTAPVTRIVAVASNEPIEGTGDGDAAPDWEITGDLTLDLRAERAGNGSGRIYSITVESLDFSGNASLRMIEVAVPKSRAAAH